MLPTKDQLERADVTLWDFLIPRVAAQHTAAIVEPVGDRRSTWWVLAELGRRLGLRARRHVSGDDVTDDAVLANTVARVGARSTSSSPTAGSSAGHELPAQWVDQHVERLGGWRLAPRLLVDQLAALDPCPALVLVPRRQARHLNSQFDYLGEVAEVMLHPDDAADAQVVDRQPVVVRSAHGELTGIASVDASIRRGAVSVPHGHQGANVNQLTSKDTIDPITGMAQYSGIAVSLHPAKDPSAGVLA